MKLKLADLLTGAVAGALIIAGFSARTAHAAPVAATACGGCAAVHEVTATIEKMHANEDHEAMLEKSAAAILQLRHDKQNHLNVQQVRELVALLAQIEPFDDEQYVIEKTEDLLQANIVVLKAEIKKLPNKDQDVVSTNVFLVLNEKDHGNG